VENAELLFGKVERLIGYDLVDQLIFETLITAAVAGSRRCLNTR